MSKVAIVFWSATGNTETMANCIAEGAGANGTIVPCAEMTPAKLAEFDVVAFGCPAMGAEQLEESEFEPMFAAPNHENPNLFSIGEGFGFFVFFGKQNEGAFPTAVCPKPYQKKDRITKVTTVKVP